MKKCMVALLLVLALLPAAAATHKKKTVAPSAKGGVASKKAPAKSAGSKVRAGGKAARKSVPRKAASSKAAAREPAIDSAATHTTKSGAARGRRTAREKVSVVGRAQMERARSMTLDAYRIAQPLGVPQRVALLTRLLYTMRFETMAGEKQQWAAELFVLAWQLPQDTTAERAARNATMATAAARMASYDADRALSMLDNEPAGATPDGDEADARSMAARLVFANYMHRHGAAGAQTLAAHALRWSEQGRYPYGATEVAMARLRSDNDAAEEFFRRELAVFQRGRDGLYGVSEFAGLLQQAAAMEAIYEDTAEEAGAAVAAQLRKLAAGDPAALSPRQRTLAVKAAEDLRIAAPRAYAALREALPELTVLRPEYAVPMETATVDPELATAFRELAAAMREGSGEPLREAIARGVQLLNRRYPTASCGPCSAPDAQSVALVSLAAYAAPGTIAEQLRGIADPYWRSYFLAIAAQQVGEPTRVADPAARKAVGKEEAEPE